MIPEISIFAEIIRGHGFGVKTTILNFVISSKHDLLYFANFDNGLASFDSVHPLLEDFEIYLSDPQSLDKINDKFKYLAGRKGIDYDCGLDSI
jgi:hypothetical protein